MGKTKLLENLFDQKKLKILKLFFAEKEKQFYLREIAKESGVSVGSTFRFIQKLLELRLIKEIKIKKFKLYQLADNESVKFLEPMLKMDKEILNIFVESVKEIPGVDQIILHGKSTKNKANLLIIGENIDPNAVKMVCVDILEKYNYHVTTLSLAKEQFEQMSAMGLYAGEKKNLWRK